MDASSSERSGRSDSDSDVGTGDGVAEEEMQDDLVVPAVENVGDETGVFGPEFDFENLSLPGHEPIELLSQLRHHGHAVSVDNAIDINVLKNWISAFYHSKGCPPLRLYREPCYIEGLEDKDGENDQSLRVQGPCRGPQSDENIVHGRRKEKLLADVMGDNLCVELKIQSWSSPKRKREPDVFEDSESAGASPAGMSGRSRKGGVSEDQKSKCLPTPSVNPAKRAEKTGYKIKSEADEPQCAFPPPLIQSVVDVSEEKLADDQLERSPPADANPVRNVDKMIFSASDNVSVDMAISKIQFAASNPLGLIREQSLDPVRDFVCAFRSSIFMHGSNYKIYNEHKTDKKRNLVFDSKSSGLKPCKAVTLGSEETPSTFDADETPVGKTRARKQLVLEFSPKFSLPTKNYILKIFSQFGSLIERETNVLTDSHSVQIVYEKDSDALSAYKSCLQIPFVRESVNYKLQTSSAHSGSHSKGSSSLKQTPPTDELMSEMSGIQQKVEIMAAMLANYHPQFPAANKASLKYDMKDLMENIERVSDKVRIMAEKTKSQGSQVD